MGEAYRLAFLDHGWLHTETLEALLANVLPRITSETPQQDPAEFRRKFKGMLQMWRAASSLSPPKINPWNVSFDE